MSHVRMCAHCGTGPNALRVGSVACCWNPVGCGCDVPSAGESTSARLRQAQEALAASQQDLTATRGQVVDLLYILDAFQIESGADRNAALQTGIDAVRQTRAELEQLRTGVAGVLAELRELAAFNRADANRFRGTSSPNGFGPHRAAEAYEKAVALLEHIHHHPDREEPTT